MYKDNYYTVPNFLTAVRMLIALGIAWYAFSLPIVAVKTLVLTATVWAAVAFATDFLDGWIARKWESQRSVWGAKWDPIADKASVLAFLMYLIFAGVFDSWWLINVTMLTLIVSREIAVSILRMVVGHENVPVVNRGKVKTFFLMSALLTFGSLELLPQWVSLIAMTLLGLASWFTVRSWWEYFRPYTPYFRN